jgi:hypothetical protein
MALKAGLFGRTKGGWIVRVVIDIVMTGCAGIFQLFDMETVRNGDIVRIQIGRGLLDGKNTGVTTDAVRVDLVQFSRKASMFPITLERKNIDTRHQGVARRMALRAIDLGMEGRLLPERGLALLVMTGETEFLLGCGIGRKCNRSIHSQDDQNAP